MTEVRIAGAAMTPFTKSPTRTVRELAEQAVADALADAGLEPRDVGMVFFANAVGGLLTGQEMVRGQAALRHSGLLGIPIVNVENACASATSAVLLASLAVRADAVEVAVAVGAERLSHADKRVTFEAIGTAVDLQEPPSSTGRGDTPGDRSSFMDVYAAMARAYLARSEASVADFARVVVKNRRHAVLNPKAQYRSDVTVEQVLASRTIAPPLTLLMCSPISDGAAAVVVCSDRFARRRLGSAARVRLRALALVSGRDRAAGEATAVRRAAWAAYEQASLGPDDIGVVELHDGAAPAELITLEELGLAQPGQAARLLADGTTALGGRLPVNPSGGLIARGHPIGATGCAQLVELVDQLRGRCGPRQVEQARVALAENAGGYLGNDSAAVTITILST